MLKSSSNEILICFSTDFTPPVLSTFSLRRLHTEKLLHYKPHTTALMSSICIFYDMFICLSSVCGSRTNLVCNFTQIALEWHYFYYFPTAANMDLVLKQSNTYTNLSVVFEMLRHKAAHGHGHHSKKSLFR